MTSWITRFDGALLEIGTHDMLILVRHRPASLTEAKALYDEVSLYGAVNYEIDTANSADAVMTAAHWYMTAAHWYLSWA